MARREVRLRGGWLRLPWGRMRVRHGGSGPVLLAVHGLGGSGRYWDGLARRVGHRFTVVAPDLAGFGRSDNPRVEYGRAFHVENLDAVVRRMAGREPVLVAGHSLGAVFGALWASAHAEEVTALALAAAPFPTARDHPSGLGDTHPVACASPLGLLGRRGHSWVFRLASRAGTRRPS